MSKKATRKRTSNRSGAAAVEAPIKAGKGKKGCPGCHEIIGARSTECPNCQHKFTGKRKKGFIVGNGAPRASTNATAGRLQDAIEVIEKSGDLTEAKKVLAVLKKLG